MWHAWRIRIFLSKHFLLSNFTECSRIFVELCYIRMFKVSTWRYTKIEFIFKSIFGLLVGHKYYVSKICGLFTLTSLVIFEQQAVWGDNDSIILANILFLLN